MSTDMMSSEHTSRFIGPFLRWLNPTISKETVEHVQLFIRKCAHMTEYGILAVLVWRALTGTFLATTRKWNWKIAGIVVLACACYAATDEFHQTFVPSRFGQATDILFDAGGALLALIVLWGLSRTFARREMAQEPV
jgi:VanZ family protein